MVREFEKVFYNQFKEHRLYFKMAKFLAKNTMSTLEIGERSKITSGGGLKRYIQNLENAEIIKGYAPFGMGIADEVIEYAPYFHRKDKSFQIDLLFRRRDKVITLCEIKFHDKLISTKVIPEVNKKCKLFPLTRGYTLERALISVHGASPSLRDSQYFHHDVSLKNILP